MSHFRLDHALQDRARFREAITDIRAKARDEKRDLSRTEAKLVADSERAITGLEAQIVESGYDLDDPTASRGMSDTDRRSFERSIFGGSATATEPSPVLRSDQSVAEYVTRKAGDFGPGSTDREFSLGRLIQAKVTGDVRHLNENEQRAMAGGTDAAGGVMVPEYLSANIIDRLRAKSVVMAAGAQTAVMLGDTLNLARMSAGNTAQWHTENAADIAATDSTWQKVSLQTRTLAVLQKVSRELMDDLSPEGVQAIETEIAQSIALALDLAILEGSQLSTSILSAATTTVTLGAGAGLKPTSYNHLVNAFFGPLKNNANEATAAILHPRDAEILALLADSTGQPLRKPTAIENLPIRTTSQLSTTRTVGASTDTSNGYIGDWGSVIVGVRPQLSISFQTLTERYSDNLQIGLLAWLRCDVALSHPESFTKIVGQRIV